MPLVPTTSRVLVDPYIGLDQSSTNTGIAVMALNKFYCFTVKPSSKDDFCKRIITIRDRVMEVVLEVKPKVVYMEETYIGPNSSTGSILVAIKTVLQVAIYEAGFTSRLIRSSNWRSLLGSKNNKESALKVLQNLTNSTNEHSQEAVGILLGGLIRDGVLTYEEAQQLYFYGL